MFYLISNFLKDLSFFYAVQNPGETGRTIFIKARLEYGEIKMTDDFCNVLPD